MRSMHENQAAEQPGFMELLGRGIRLKCPKCGTGRLFRGLLKMHQQCPECAFKFEREPGYFIGAMFVNYFVTAIILVVGIFSLDYFTNVAYFKILAIWGVVCVIFPIVFFRFSRGLWLSFDYFFDPDAQ